MTEPLCPYFGKCGGCSSQHIAYDVQLDNKRKQLSQSIKYDQDSIEIFSGEPYNYRNRMDFIFHKSGLGLREKGDWKSIVDIERCAISDERLNELLKYVREYFKDIGDEAFDVKRHSGTFRYAVIRTPSNDSSISFVLNSDSSNNGEAVSKIKEFAKHTKANNVVVTYVPSNTDVSISEEFFVVKGSDMLNEDYVDRSFSYSVQGFFQNNSAMAESMQEHVQSLIKKYDTKDLTLLDLYCGVGTFGIINSSSFNNVVMVESDKNCIDAAKINIENNHLKNVEAVLLDAMSIKKLGFQKELFVITDPPRSGMHQKTIEQLKRLKPKTMIYISCNIQQLGKDLEKFKEYSIKSVAMFDLFPQTPHVEAIVELLHR